MLSLRRKFFLKFQEEEDFKGNKKDEKNLKRKTLKIFELRNIL